jgi:hypothetical protein
MPPNNPATGHSFNVKMDPATYAALTAMHQKEGLSRGQIIRKAIQARYDMLFRGALACADGQQCLCPINHTVRQQNGPQHTPQAPADPDVRQLPWRPERPDPRTT